jgi:hypothetical protein
LNSAEGISSRPTEQEGGPPNDALTGDEIRSCHGRDCGKDDCTTCTSMRTYYDRLDELCGCTCHNEDDADA